MRERWRMGGVSYETLLLLVYAGSTRKALAFSSTYGRGLWWIHQYIIQQSA